MVKKYYDNTMISSYKDCPRKYYLRHVKNWRSGGTSLPLSFGLAWHAAMDIVWQHAKRLDKMSLAQAGYAAFCNSWEEQGLPVDLSLEQIEASSPRVPPVAAEMLHGYIDVRWRLLQEADLVASEQPFAVPIPGMDERWYIGRLDKVIRTTEVIPLEHKTTTEYKKDGGFKASYVEGWFSDSQVKGYEFGGGLFFPGVSQVWVDSALVHKTVHDKFRFIPVSHPMPMLQEWVGDTRNWIRRIEADTTAGYFPKNEGSCLGKFGPCSFLPVCRTTPDPGKMGEPPEGYITEAWEPFDLLGLEKIFDKESTNEQTSNNSNATDKSSDTGRE